MKLNIYLLCNSSILQSVYPKRYIYIHSTPKHLSKKITRSIDLSIYIYICLHKDLYTNIYSSFIYNVPNWEQPKCLLAGAYIKIWQILITKYYSAIKWNQLLIYTTTRMDLKITLSKRRPVKRVYIA